MKKLIISVILLSISAMAMAEDEVALIYCTTEAQSATIQELSSMVRRKQGFEVGELSLERKDVGEYKNMIISKGYNEDKDIVTYLATVAGTVTNKANNKSVTSISQCEIKFVASTCALQTQLCSGI